MLAGFFFSEIHTKDKYAMWTERRFSGY